MNEYTYAVARIRALEVSLFSIQHDRTADCMPELSISACSSWKRRAGEAQILPEMQRRY